MRRSALLLVVVLSATCCYAQNHNQPKGVTIIRPYLSVPDSLGGKNLKGYAHFSLTVHRLGTLLNYQLISLSVSYDGSAPRLIFKDTTAIPCNTHLSPWNEETLRFIPWLREYLARTQFRTCFDPREPEATDRAYLMGFDIYFNPVIEELPSGHGYE